jgi:cell division protein FtsQ
MNSDFIYTAGGESRAAHPVSDDESFDTRTKSSRKITKGLKRVFVIAGIILAAQLTWLFAISPIIPFSTIEVHGFYGFEPAEILAVAGINENSSYFSTNVEEVREKLQSYILVESAMVIKRFPDKLSIFLSPREAAAVALANNGSRQLPLFIDRNGVFYKIGNTSSLDTNLPVLSGMENPRLNMRLPTALVPLVENLSEIAVSSPELLAAISEIRIEQKAWDGFDLVLYPVHSPIKVRIENNLTEDKLRYMLLMLNVFESSSAKPEEIDFRSGMGSYRIREQSS